MVGCRGEARSSGRFQWRCSPDKRGRQPIGCDVSQVYTSGTLLPGAILGSISAYTVRSAPVCLLARGSKDTRALTRGLKIQTQGVYMYRLGLLKEERDVFDRTANLKFRLQGLNQQGCSLGKYLERLALANESGRESSYASPSTQRFPSCRFFVAAPRNTCNFRSLHSYGREREPVQLRQVTPPTIIFEQQDGPWKRPLQYEWPCCRAAGAVRQVCHDGTNVTFSAHTISIQASGFPRFESRWDVPRPRRRDLGSSVWLTDTPQLQA